MGRPDDISRRRLGEDENCDVLLLSRRTGRAAPAAAYIPAFSGAALVGLFAPAAAPEEGDEVRRLPDGPTYRVLQVLRPGWDGRVPAHLERFEPEKKV